MNVTTGPYFDGSGLSVLRESVIVVVDILGYEEEVKRTSKDGQSGPFLESLHPVLSKSFRIVDDATGMKWFAKMMTDNLLVAYPFLDDDTSNFKFEQACLKIGRFQREMIKFGLPVRGGISIGQIHVSDLLIFPSENILSEMKEAETIAGSPRIVLLDSAKIFLSDNSGLFPDSDMDGLLWKDEDTARFVNYLRPLASLRPQSKMRIEERNNEILAHKQFIEGRLKDFSQCQRVYFKYVWMANYHNRFCRLVPDFNSTGFHIDLNLTGPVDYSSAADSSA